MRHRFKDLSGPPESPGYPEESQPAPTSSDESLQSSQVAENSPTGISETEPSPLTDGDVLGPQPFPIHALNPTQRSIAEETARVHQIDVALPGMVALAVFAGALGKAFVVRGAASGRDTYTNVYVLAGAPKGYGKGAAASIVAPLITASDEMAETFRKTESPRLVAEQKVLQEQITKLVKQLGKSGSSWTEDETGVDEQNLIAAQERLAAITPLLNWPPSLWIGSATAAALSEFVARNGHTIFSFSPEAGELVRISLGKFSKENAADFDLLLSGYTVEPFRETRIGRGDKQITPCINVLWFCQPFLIREMIGSKEALERGLMARMLMFVVEHSEIPEDDGVHRETNPEALRKWDRLVRDGIDARNSPSVIECSPEAREVFRDFHNESVRHRNGEFRDIQGELARWRENAIRLAAGQCIADTLSRGEPMPNRITLTAIHADRGVTLARWAQYSGLRLMQASRMEQKKKRVSRLTEILLENRGPVTLRDLENRHSFASDEVEALVREFPDQLALEKKKPIKGRPSTVLKLVVARK